MKRLGQEPEYLFGVPNTPIKEEPLVVREPTYDIMLDEKEVDNWVVSYGAHIDRVHSGKSFVWVVYGPLGNPEESQTWWVSDESHADDLISWATEAKRQFHLAIENVKTLPQFIGQTVVSTLLIGEN